MNKIGKEAVRIIKTRTQDKQQGVATFEGPKSRLKRLAKSTVERRKRFKGLSSKTTPGKSNLTMTGQLIDSIKYYITGRAKITIRPSTQRNKLVAEHVSKDRPFLNLSKSEVVSLVKLFTSFFRGR